MQTGNEIDVEMVNDVLDEIDKKENEIERAIQLKWNKIAEEIRLKNVHFIKNLITSKEIEVNAVNPCNGKTLLIYAVIIGDLDLVTAICNFGASVKIRDHQKLDALDYATKYGRYKITELIYYRQLSSSLGNDLKAISIAIHSKNKEADIIYNMNKELSQQIINFMIEIIKKREIFDETLLYYAWYFVLIEAEKNQNDPFQHELWKSMMSVYTKIISNTNDKSGWSWLKKRFIGSAIWYLPHPHFNKIQQDEQKEKSKNDDEMEYILKGTLFYELLQKVRTETKKQSDLLLKQKIEKLKDEKPEQWKNLISYDVITKYSSNARQDFCDCLVPKYSAIELNEDRYPSSTHFSARKHYDTNVYLNQLMFNANIIDLTFQNDMKLITKTINQQIGINTAYRAGPVKTLSRSKTKCENDYINEQYPTSAKILDINRCAIQSHSIQELMKFIQLFTQKINQKKAGSIKSIIRCKNGWNSYNPQYPQYTDIKLNVLVQANGKTIVAECQFLLDLMSAFKKKSHKLYSVERKFELVYNFGLLRKKK
eukprot:3157_1